MSGDQEILFRSVAVDSAVDSATGAEYAIVVAATFDDDGTAVWLGTIALTVNEARAAAAALITAAACAAMEIR